MSLMQRVFLLSDDIFMFHNLIFKQMAKTTTRHRDAGTGEYVTKKYADKHPKTTVKETDKKKGK